MKKTWLEIFGYVGMVLVLISMIMTDVTWLRILNMSGAAVCATYGVLTRTWPTACLNIGLFVIQAVQIILLYL